VSSMPDESIEQDSNRFPGERLIIAREAQGYSQQAIAEELHLPVRYIQWIEEGAFEKLPSLVFARGYVRSYAKVVHTDAEPIISAFDCIYGGSCQKNNIKSVSKVQQQVKLGDPVMRWSGWFFLVLVIAAVVWWWKTQYGLAPPAEPVAAMAPALSVETADGNTLILPQLVDEPEVTDAQPSDPLLEEEEPKYLSDEEAAQLQSQLATEGAEISSEEQSESSEVLPIEGENEVADTSSAEVAKLEGLNILFSDECWVTVKNANGRTLFNNAKRKGQTLELKGQEPLSILIGRVSSVERISYNSKVIDLAPFTNKNVAKLTLP